MYDEDKLYDMLRSLWPLVPITGLGGPGRAGLHHGQARLTT